MTKGERISKLESRMTTAEELLAELRGRGGGIAVTGDLAEVANSLPGPLHYGMQQEIDQLRATLDDVRKQRDDVVYESEALGRRCIELTQERDELRRHLGKVMSEREKQKKLIDKVIDERDALRARIDAGVDVTLTGETARLIDRQPIAQDERKGDRRRHKEETTRDEESGIRY